jgi:hypothetical protein
MSETLLIAVVGGGFAALNLVIAGINQYRTNRQTAGIKREETAFEQLTRIYQEARADLKALQADFKTLELENEKLRDELRDKGGGEPG